jgi:hypothetical protein
MPNASPVSASIPRPEAEIWARSRRSLVTTIEARASMAAATTWRSLGLMTAGTAFSSLREDELVAECVSHVADPATKRVRVESREGLEKVAFDLAEDGQRDSRFEQRVVHGGEQEVAGHDRDEDTGVEGGDQQRHVP